MYMNVHQCAHAKASHNCKRAGALVEARTTYAHVCVAPHFCTRAYALMHSSTSPLHTRDTHLLCQVLQGPSNVGSGSGKCSGKCSGKGTRAAGNSLNVQIISGLYASGPEDLLAWIERIKQHPQVQEDHIIQVRGNTVGTLAAPDA